MISFIGLTFIEVVQDPVDRLYEKQIIGLLAGIAIAIIVSLCDYHFLIKAYWLYYIINLGALVFTRLFGVSHYDAKRWIQVGGIQIQPSEFTKFFLVLFVAGVLTRFYKKIDKFWFLIVVSGIVAVPLVFILIQPDLSTTIAIFVAYAMMIFLSGMTYKILLPLIVLAIPVCMGLWWYIQQPFQKLLVEYQQNRILALKNPELYPDLMWQQDNAMKAIKNGGLTGIFMTKGPDTAYLKCAKLPAIESDFIFTGIAESYGFIGVCVMIALLAFFVFQSFRIAHRAADRTGMLIAGGIGSLIAVQTIINIAVNTSIFPNTGIPFPFMSSGLSALFGNYFMLGLVLNVGVQRQGRRKDTEEDEFAMLNH